jgi:hypothetical protein
MENRFNVLNKLYKNEKIKIFTTYKTLIKNFNEYFEFTDIHNCEIMLILDNKNIYTHTITVGFHDKYHINLSNFISANDVFNKYFEMMLYNILLCFLSLEKSDKKIQILCPSINNNHEVFKNIHLWGDFNIACGLKKYFERNNVKCIIKPLPYWNDDIDHEILINIVLYGNFNIKTINPLHKYYGWILYHSNNDINFNNLEHVFISSDKYNISNHKKSLLYQCTDHEIFNPYNYEKIHNKHTFTIVANYHFNRPCVDFIKKHNLMPKIYGNGWNEFECEYINKKKIPMIYKQSKYIINDHMDSMIKYGFFSNKSIDIIASGSKLIVDSEVLKTMFDNVILFDEFKGDCEYTKENEYLQQYNKVIDYGLTFEKTVEKMIKIIYQ